MKRKKLTVSKKNKGSKIGLVLILLLLFIGFFVIYIIKTFPSDENSDNKIQQIKKVTQDIKRVSELIQPLDNFHVPVLMYHYVEYVTDERDTIRKSLDIVPYIFEKQLQTLIDANYTFITMSELGDVLDGKMELEKKPIIITFDDGYRDFYTDVFPIIKKHNVKVTAYIVPGFTNKLNYMFSKQIEEITQSGLVEIGAHTVNHMNLKNRPFNAVQYEIAQSKTVLEEKYNMPVVSFAYPFGAFDDQSIEIVKNSGFKTAVSTLPGTEVNQGNRFSIYRIRPGNRTGESLLNYLEKTDFKN